MDELIGTTGSLDKILCLASPNPFDNLIKAKRMNVWLKFHTFGFYENIIL